MGTPLQKILEDAGVSKDDLDESVEAARGLTKNVRFGAALAAHLASEIEKKLVPGSKLLRGAFVLRSLAEQVRDGADQLLRPGEKKP